MHPCPEALFVNRCVREPGVTPSGELAPLAASIRRPNWLAATALRHGVGAFVLEAVARERLVVPATLLEAVREGTFLDLAYVMMLDGELARLSRAFATRRLRLIVLKGPVLARTIYAHAGLRPYRDLDLLVHQEDEEAAVSTLVASGLVEAPYEAEEARRARGDVPHGAAFHRRFVSENCLAQVELHVDPFQLGLRTACEGDRWRRAVPVPGIEGILGLSASDQIVHLSVHAHKHGFNRLIWLKDLDLLLRARPNEIDWDLVCEVAGREGVRASIWYSLHLARVLLAAPVSRNVLARLRPSLPVATIYRAIWPVDQIGELNGHMRRRAVQFHAAESWRGMLPSLVLMGRRGDRTRAILQGLRSV